MNAMLASVGKIGVEKKESLDLSSKMAVEKEKSSDFSGIKKQPSTMFMRLTSTPVGNFNPAVKDHVGAVQQAVNTCNLSAITLAFKILGITVSVDQIFDRLKIPVSWVVSQGLTLAQVYIVLEKICGSPVKTGILAPGMTVECFHLDEGVADLNSMKEFVKDNIRNDDTVIIGNFTTKIACGAEGGGGHFAVLSGYDEESDMISVADVHPKKYGAHWACSAKKMFAAMVDKDSSSKRGRGIIRLAFSSKSVASPLDMCKRVVSLSDHKYNNPEDLLWLSRWSCDLPCTSFQGTPTMGGLNALGLIFSGFLSEEDFDAVCIHDNNMSGDWLLRKLNLSIVETLGDIFTSHKLGQYARRACSIMSHGMAVSVESCAEASTLKHHISREQTSAGLALIDINQAFGYEVLDIDKSSEEAALCHGVQHWCGVVSASDEEVIIAEPRACGFGRLWRCSTENFCDSLIDEHVVVVRAIVN